MSIAGSTFIGRTASHYEGVRMQEQTMMGGRAAAGGSSYPLEQTAAMLNDRLGLYLSPEQQRGLATGLLVGAVLGGAILAAGVASALRDR